MVDAVAAADPAAAVPTCPGWSVRDVVEHTGGVHRWANGLVADQVQRPTRRPPIELTATDGTELAAWLADGGRALLTTLRSASPDDPMWAWGADQHVRFWVRRQLHETLIHRVDCELATGRESLIGPEVASDNIDELLEIIPRAAPFQPLVDNLRGSDSLHLHATDAPEGVNGEWLITYHDDGFTWTHEHGRGSVAVRAPLAELALLLNRRTRPGESVEVLGDTSVLDHWIENSAL